MADVTERIFHFSDGAAHKFWAVAVSDATQTVRWGRIGTTGQTQTKAFETGDAARAATERLVAAKVKKGYAEVSAEAASRAEPKPTAARRGASPWRQMRLSFDDAAAAATVPATLELF